MRACELFGFNAWYIEYTKSLYLLNLGRIQCYAARKIKEVSVDIRLIKKATHVNHFHALLLMLS